jgi:hypothetical protein
MKNQTAYINPKMINSIVPYYNEKYEFFKYKQQTKIFGFVVGNAGFYDIFGGSISIEEIKKMHQNLYVEYNPAQNGYDVFYKPYLKISLLDQTNKFIVFDNVDEMEKYIGYLNKILILLKIN